MSILIWGLERCYAIFWATTLAVILKLVFSQRRDQYFFQFRFLNKLTARTLKKSKNGILLLTFGIGANGLNLQCADTVLIADFWWNADKTRQAIARILRYGQEATCINIYYY